jgi:hypothetical protein
VPRPKGLAKTGGRQKGSANRRTRELLAAADAQGQSPLEYMLAVMRDPKVDPDRRDRMAAAAAPFIHARLASLEARVESVHTLSGPVLDLRAVEILSSLDQLALPAIEDEDEAEELAAVPLLSGMSDGS